MTPFTRAVITLLALGLAAASWWAFARSRHEPAPRTLLLTGFGPFGSYATNPSWEVARALDGETIGGLRVVAARLDVTWADAPEQLQAALAEHAPDLVLSLGVAPTPAIRLERLARNRDAGREPDVAGVLRAGTPIREDGPATLASRLPLERLQAGLEAAGFEVVTSDDAGGYLCNHVFYRLLDGLDPAVPAGFVHVPPLEGPWDAVRLEQAIRCVIRCVIEPLGAEAAQ